MATIVIWFLQTFDTRLNVVSDSADSLLAFLGHAVAPIFTPLGFGDWRMVTALVTGITAKEAVVSTLAVLFSTDVDALSTVIKGVFTALSATSFLTFTLLYTPCAAAIAAIRREWGSSGKTVLIVFMQCAVAWFTAFVIFNVGGLLL